VHGSADSFGSSTNLEDYLFPEKLFAAIELPKTVGRKLLLAT